ncbi:hypothetical protein K438DRAFT_1797460 [Mycena galopus ATCC 62051]|nr:hypothetical protein K438DRAFT_1880618 [Mycena galopus ATCC 62051]KAF8140773.1 hypothetical protein K438DRAFT_1879324 [Mycena galopus ATCC 62051]KAF8216561.1 hypothetical protein K438DRAFT_1797460 [Mycena galopus ATCC 62051]
MKTKTRFQADGLKCRIDCASRSFRLVQGCFKPSGLNTPTQCLGLVLRHPPHLLTLTSRPALHLVLWQVLPQNFQNPQLQGARLLQASDIAAHFLVTSARSGIRNSVAMGRRDENVESKKNSRSTADRVVCSLPFSPNVADLGFISSSSPIAFRACRPAPARASPRSRSSSHCLGAPAPQVATPGPTREKHAPFPFRPDASQRPPSDVRRARRPPAVRCFPQYMYFLPHRNAYCVVSLLLVFIKLRAAYTCSMQW